MASIGRQLTAGLLVAVFATSAAIGAALYVGVRRALVVEHDRALAARALSLLSPGEFDHGELEFEFSPSVMEPFERRDAPDYFQIRQSDGTSFMRSPSLRGEDLPQLAGSAARPHAADVVLPDGSAGRAVGMSATVRAEEDLDAEEVSQATVSIVVARSRAELDRVLGLVSASIVAMSLLLPTGVALAVWFGVKRGLRPLGKLASETASIDVSTLSHRFATQEVPDELKPICTRLNELLARLQEAMERERRFAGAAAHELRTPIAELKNLSEVALRWPDEPSARESMKDAYAIACQMESLVAQLMALARGKEGRQLASTEPVAVADALAEAWRPFEMAAKEKKLCVSLDVPPDARIDTERALFASILGNLLSNAVEYTPAGGAIAVRCELSEESLLLVIENTQQGLGEEDIPKLFEPFWRKEASRTDSAAHSGLGLALVAMFARVLGGGACAEFADGNALRVKVRLPRLRNGESPVSCQREPTAERASPSFAPTK